jgi:hypothetical protein
MVDRELHTAGTEGSSGPSFHHSGGESEQGYPTRVFFLGPDDILIELLADKDLATVSENHQIHFYTLAIDGISKNFGTALRAFGKVNLTNLPGETLIFSPPKCPPPGPRAGRWNHIGFEVKDLERFSKTLDTSDRKVPPIDFAVAS